MQIYGKRLSGKYIQRKHFRKDSYFQYANFNESRFENLLIDGSRLTNSEISECKVKNLELNRTVLNESNLFRTYLRGVDITNSDISGVILSKDFAELRGAAINSIQAAELIRTFGIKVEF